MDSATVSKEEKAAAKRRCQQLEKERKKQERETAKAAKENEKRQKLVESQVERENSKANNKTDCSVSARLDDVYLADEGSKWRIDNSKLMLDNTISFVRKLIVLNETDQRVEKEIIQSEFILVMTERNFEELVDSESLQVIVESVQLEINNSINTNKQSVSEPIKCALTLAVLCNSAVYISQLSSIKKFTAVRQLQSTLRVNNRFVSTLAEFAFYIRGLHRAIALIPHKWKIQQMDIVDSTNVTVGLEYNNDEELVKQWWRLMLLQIPGSSAGHAQMISTEYPSPVRLRRWLIDTPEQDAIKHLSDLVICRGDGRGATERRLGAVFAQKLRLLLLTENGENIIG